MADSRIRFDISARFVLDCGHDAYVDQHCAHMQCWNYASKCGLHGIFKTSDRCNRDRDVHAEKDDIMCLKHVIEDMPPDLPQGQYQVVFDRMEGDTAFYKYKGVEDG